LIMIMNDYYIIYQMKPQISTVTLGVLVALIASSKSQDC